MHGALPSPWTTSMNLPERYNEDSPEDEWTPTLLFILSVQVIDEIAKQARSRPFSFRNV